MFSVLSTISRFTRPYIWPPATRPFSCFNRLRRAPGRSAEEEAARLESRRLKHRQRYANDPEYRQKLRDAAREFRRRPDIRAANKAQSLAYYEGDRERYNARSTRDYKENIRRRRSMMLFRLLCDGTANKYTWKTHIPIRYSDKVAHHCTGCNRNRFLERWWQEKSEIPESSEQSNPDRYMCTNCFANDWPRVVPETYTGKLHGIFKSPDFPPSKAEKEELAMKKGAESDKPEK